MRDGNQWRPFIHVKDTSRAFLKVLRSNIDLVNGEIFNVGDNNQNVQILNLAKMVAKGAGMPFKFEWYGDPDHRSYQVSFDKINKKLGYKTIVKIEDGAREIAIETAKLSRLFGLEQHKLNIQLEMDKYEYKFFLDNAWPLRVPPKLLNLVLKMKLMYHFELYLVDTKRIFY